MRRHAAHSARADYRCIIPGTPTGGPFGSNKLVFHDEFVTAEIGQVGTQFDGPGHIGVRTSKGDLFYNGREREASLQARPGQHGRSAWAISGSSSSPRRASSAVACCSMLTKYRGVNRLPIPKSTDSPGIVTADDVKKIVEAQGLDPIGEGDCVFLYTGHGDLWKNADWPNLSPEEKAARTKEFISRRAWVRPERLRVLRRAEDHSDRRRHLGQRRPAGRRDRGRGRALPHRDPDPVWHLEHREPRLLAAARGRGLRVPVRLGAAQDGRCHRLARATR